MQISISNAIGGGGGNLGSGGGLPFASTKSFTFDGSTDFISMGDVLDTSDTGADPLSLSLWFKTTDSSTQVLVGKQNPNFAFEGYSIAIVSVNKIYFNIGSYTGNKYIQLRSATISSISDGNWHHLVVTYDGSRAASGVNIYLDDSPLGLSIGKDVPPEATQNTQDFMIAARGTSSSNTLRFDGNIDEVAYFTSELSASDVNTIYGTGAPNDISSFNPVGWWRMGEQANYAGATWTLTDQGSGGNDGTSTTLPAPPTEPSTDVPS